MIHRLFFDELCLFLVLFLGLLSSVLACQPSYPTESFFHVFDFDPGGRSPRHDPPSVPAFPLSLLFAVLFYYEISPLDDGESHFFSSLSLLVPFAAFDLSPLFSNRVARPRTGSFSYLTTRRFILISSPNNRFLFFVACFLLKADAFPIQLCLFFTDYHRRRCF